MKDRFEVFYELFNDSLHDNSIIVSCISTNDDRRFRIGSKICNKTTFQRTPDLIRQVEESGLYQIIEKIYWMM